jgi:hypothetical protein
MRRSQKPEARSQKPEEKAKLTLEGFDPDWINKSQKPEARSQKKRRSQKSKARSQKKSQKQSLFAQAAVSGFLCVSLFLTWLWRDSIALVV